MIKNLIILIPVFFFQLAAGQQLEDYHKKNSGFMLLNYHLERRGSNIYDASNIDFAVGYERDIIGIGDHRFFAGVRTGFYREYDLTGNGWSHPDKTRFFLGISPSYMLYFSKNFRMQLNFLYDVLLPDDYDEIWSYWALEPSFQYFIGDIFIGISLTRGVFLFFDPRAYMVKAGLKLGYRF